MTRRGSTLLPAGLRCERGVAIAVGNDYRPAGGNVSCIDNHTAHLPSLRRVDDHRESNQHQTCVRHGPQFDTPKQLP